MLAHHMAKVLAYTGEPIVIDKVFAIMPKGEADEPGQIDYMYALRVIEKGWTPARAEGDRVVRQERRSGAAARRSPAT